MKKKMLFMAAIAGLVTLGSCVKDDVSGSVEAVRQAKANELNGKAAEANANAAKTNAETALLNATMAAETAIKQAQAAMDQARAEAQQLTTQLQKERYAAELESVVSAFEATTAANKLSVQRDLNSLADELKNASTKELDFITNLINRYNAAYAKFTRAQEALVNTESQLAQAKISAEYAAKSNAVAIQTKLDQKAEYEAILAALNELEQEGTTDSELKIKKGSLAAQIVNEANAFDPNNEAVKELVEASKALKKASDAYDAFVTNPAVIDDIWDTANDTAGSDGFIDDDDFDHTFFGAIGKINQLVYPRLDAATTSYQLPIGATTVWANDYIEEVGTPQDIYGTFKQYSGVEVKDANAATYGTAAWTPSFSATAKQSGTWSKSQISISQFRVNERTKLEADKYFENLPVATKTALDDANTALDEAIDLLGTPSDAATKKTTLPGNQDGDGKQVLTLYAEKVKAEAEAKTASETLEAEMTALEDAEKALAAAYALPGTAPTRALDIIMAKIAIGRALENIYGSNGYVIAGVPTDIQADTYVNTAGGGTYFADIAANKQFSAIKTLVDALITPPASTTDPYSKGLDNTGTRDETVSYQADLIKANGKAANADVDINGGKKYDIVPTSPTFGTQIGATLIGQIANIATQKDIIATTLKPAYEKAAAKVDEYKALVAAIDLEKYDAIVTTLKEAISTFNTAYAAAMKSAAPVTDLQKEYNALPASTEHIEKQITYVTEQLGKVEKDLANAGYDSALAGPAVTDQPTLNVWDPIAQSYTVVAASMSWDEIVDYWENQVDQAEANLLIAASELAAAQKAIQDAEIEINLDGDDDDEPAEEPAEEPVEEPTEEPTEEPAEEETPAEP